jgi:hypothetical protein
VLDSLVPECSAYLIQRANVSAELYSCVAPLLKVAILFQWCRIFVPLGARNSFYWIARTLIWFSVLFYVACSFAQFFRCDPIKKAWNPQMKTGNCGIDWYSISITTAVVNAILDSVIFVLPQKTIWTLKMSRDRKFGIATVFAFGVLWVPLESHTFKLY